MDTQKAYWNQVWDQTDKSGGYGFLDSRIERTLDKIGYFIQNGIIFKDGDKVLEAGCGDGLILLSLLRLFKIEGHGLDFSESAMERAKHLMEIEGNKYNYDLGNINFMPYSDNFFDKIVCLGVIEHFEDPTDSLREIYRVLKPGGKLIMMTPNKKSLGVLDRVVKEMIGKWPFGYQTEYTPNKLYEMMTSTGFQILKSEGLLRRRLPNDNRTFKIIGKVDHMINLIVKDWGFYSYVFATK